MNKAVNCYFGIHFFIFCKFTLYLHSKTDIGYNWLAPQNKRIIIIQGTMFYRQFFIKTNEWRPITYTHYNSVHDCDDFLCSQTKKELSLMEPLHSPTISLLKKKTSLKKYIQKFLKKSLMEFPDNIS